MRKIFIFISALLVIGSFCGKGDALFVLDPEKDIKAVLKEIKNDDGTTTVIQEPEIIKPFSESITKPETILKENPQRNKISNAKGLEKKLGLYKPTQPMFTVTTKKPADWRMPDNPAAIAGLGSHKNSEKPVSYSWIITTISMGIIAFGVFRLYLYFKDEPGANKA